MYVAEKNWNDAAESIKKSDWCKDNVKRCNRDVEKIKSCDQKK
jgi:hypothetical protein